MRTLTSEPTLRIVPALRQIIPRSTALEVTNAPLRLTSRTRSQSSSSIRASGRFWLMLALLTRTSSRPHPASTSFTIPSVPGPSTTDTLNARASPPPARTASSVASAPLSSRV